jgi:hypothetical protein
MKKYLITGVVAMSFLIPAISFAQTSPTQTCITQNIGFGSRHAEVSVLQKFLNDNGYLKVAPTGYFGTLTLAAVKAFQGENGVPETGFVGSLTRAKITSCSPVVSANITVTAPQGGETWNWNSTQTINWTDSNTYIQAPTYDIKLQKDLDCQPNQPCIALFPMPVLIARNVMASSTGYSWRVGSFVYTGSLDTVQTLVDGKYRIWVCGAGNTNIEDLSHCAKAASYVTLVTP